MTRLARLARLRAQLQHQAEIELGRAVREVAEAETRVTEIENTPFRADAGPTKISLLLTCEELGAVARKTVELRRAREQQRRVEERAAVLEHRKMETLADRAAELERKETERREQRASDDRVQARWRRR